MSRTRTFALALLIALPGCSTLSVPVPVSCVESLPERPYVRTTDELLAMPRYARTLATWSDRLALDAYARELEAALAACRAP